MKKAYRVLSFLLCLAMLMCSCSQGTENSDTAEDNAAAEATENVAEAAEEVVEEEYDPFAELEAVDYGGKDFNFLTREAYQSHQWTEGLTGDAFNDAVFTRNSNVEEKYNVTINSIAIGGEWADRSSFLATVKNSVTAGDGAYDLIDGYAATIGDGFADGLYLNLLEVPNLNTEADWWSSLIRDELTVNGKLFAITGDIAISLWEQTQVIFFNKTLLNNFGYTSPYTLVNEGTWTFDNYINMIEGSEIDVDGDGQWTSADSYGAIYFDALTFDNLHNAFGVAYTTHEADGSVTLDLYNEQIVDIAEKAYNLAFNNTGVYFTNTSVDERPDCRQMFTENRGLFYISVLEDASIMRDMEADFGILPYPKADEAQEMYYTTSRDGRSMFAIAIDVKDVSFAGMITEALCVAGNQEVIPVYYDTVLKSKTARDEESGTMLDIIRNGIVLDFAAEYAVQMQRAGFIIRDCIEGEKDIASLYKSNEKVYAKAFEKFIKAYTEE